MEVGSSSSSKGKNVFLDEEPISNSCGLCDLTGAPQLKACLKFLKSQGSCAKRDGDKEKKKNEQVMKMWLPCGLLSLMKVLRRDNCKVDRKVVKPLNDDASPRRRKFGRIWHTFS